MSAIGKGDWIQAVITAHSGLEGICKGNVYFVEELDPEDNEPCPACQDDGRGLLLSGFDHSLGAWCACGFKPLGGNARSETRKAPAELEPA